MNINKLYFTGLLCIGLLLCGGCSNAQTQKDIPQKQLKALVLPQIPDSIRIPQDRADYLSVHYWDHFDFGDTALTHLPEITEQAFADFIPVLSIASEDKMRQGIYLLLDRAMKGSRIMFDCFSDLCEKYLYDPNSPLRDEELYIPCLQYLIASNQMTDVEKERPRYLLRMALKNRPGTIATDFTYTLANDKTGKLSAIQADYTVLFFNNPDCQECKRVKEYMDASPTFHSVAVLAMYTDADLPLWLKAGYPHFMINAYDAGQTIQDKQLYDLKAIPTLYLLDKEKRIILKDATVEKIEEWLEENK